MAVRMNKLKRNERQHRVCAVILVTSICLNIFHGVNKYLVVREQKTKLFTSFSAIAELSSPKTDKVAHGYARIYDEYFKKELLKTKIRLFEIGVGCGVGASTRVWPAVFPKSDIWMAELQESCVKPFWTTSSKWNYVLGDQGDVRVLQQWVNATSGNFDFIIDDGSHRNAHIWTSFQYLFKYGLKAGGVYFIEDLHVGRVATGENWFAGGVNNDGISMIEIISEWVDQLVTSSARNIETHPRSFRYMLPEDVARIDCIQDMCAITKQKENMRGNVF
jgi:hypothetical protein